MIIYEQYDDVTIRAYSDSNKEIIEQPTNDVYGEIYALGHIENGIAKFDNGYSYIEGNDMPIEEIGEEVN